MRGGPPRRGARQVKPPLLIASKEGELGQQFISVSPLIGVLVSKV